jgi:hypothetical protein
VWPIMGKPKRVTLDVPPVERKHAQTFENEEADEWENPLGPGIASTPEAVVLEGLESQQKMYGAPTTAPARNQHPHVVVTLQVWIRAP